MFCGLLPFNRSFIQKRRPKSLDFGLRSRPRVVVRRCSSGHGEIQEGNRLTCDWPLKFRWEKFRWLKVGHDLKVTRSRIFSLKGAHKIQKPTVSICNRRRASSHLMDVQFYRLDRLQMPFLRRKVSAFPRATKELLLNVEFSPQSRS